MSCDLVPKILNKNNALVESKLFKDLQEKLQDREKTRKFYDFVHSDEFIEYFGNWMKESLDKTDENGEPLVDEVIVGKTIDEGWGEYVTHYAPAQLINPDDIDGGLQGEPMFGNKQLAQEAYRFDNIIQAKEAVLRNLYKARKEFQHTDYRKFEEINFRIALLTDEITSMRGVQTRPNTVAEIKDYADSDYNQLLSIFEQESLSKEEIVYAQKLIETWTNMRNNMMEESDFESQETIDIANQIENMFRDIHDKYIRPAQRKHAEKVSDYANEEADTLKPIFDETTNRIALKDTPYLSSEMTNISRSGRIIGDAMANLKKDAHQRSRDEYNREIEEVYQLHEEKEAFKRENGLTEQELFDQLDEDGNPTGNNADRFSRKWYNDKAQALANGTKAYVRFINNYGLPFDPRYVSLDKHVQSDDMTVEMPDKYLRDSEQTEDQKKYGEDLNALLKQNLSETGYQEIMDALEKDMETWRQRREAFYQVMVSKGFTGDELDYEMQKWLDKNSPYEAMDMRDKPANRKKEEGYIAYNRGENIIRDIPERILNDKDTGYYDQKFERIESDERVLNYYKKMAEVVNKYSMFLSAHQRKELQDNSLPYQERTIMEKAMEGNKRAAFADIYESIVQNGIKVNKKAFNTKDDRNLDTPGVSKQDVFDKKVLNKKNAREAELERALTDEELTQVNKDAQQEMYEEQEKDRTKVLEGFIAGVVAHKYMSRIETDMNIMETVINDGLEIQGGKSDQTLIGEFYEHPDLKEGGLTNMKAMTKYFVDSFYGQAEQEIPLNSEKKTKDEEGNTVTKQRRVFTKNEKVRYKQLEKRLEMFKEQKQQWEQKMKDDKNYDEAGPAIQRLDELIADTENEMEGLGGSPSGSGYMKNVLKYVQVQTMGYNFFSAFATVGMATIANIIESGDGRSFGEGKLAKAYGMVLQSVLKNASLNTLETDLAKKVRNIADTFNISATETSNPAQDASDISRQRPKGFKSLLMRALPYKAQQHAEYMAQAPIMIARMKTLTIQDKEGNTRELWEAFDSEGSFKTEEFGENNYWNGDPGNPNHNKGRSYLKSNIDALIGKNHGDYDSELPIKFTENIWKQMLAQFRNWIFESAASRYQARKPDKRLGYEVKGRYRTGLGIVGLSGDVTESKLHQTLFNMKQLLRKVMFRRTNFEELYDEVDAANMRANLNELLLATSMFGIAIMLKGAGGDDEDEQAAATYLTNMLNRLQNDIMMYTNPFSAYEILKSPVAGFTLIEDVYNFSESTVMFMGGEDEIERGPFTGHSRFVRETLNLMPLTTEVKKQIDLASMSRGSGGISSMLANDDDEE